MVQITNLSMQYATKKLFENVNLKLDAGKKYGLIGANGAGKSTLLSILSGHIEPSSGEVCFAPNTRIGVLGQNQYAFEDFSLQDAVLYGNKRLFDAMKEKEKIYETGNFDDESTNKRLAELEIICAEEDSTYQSAIIIEKLLEDLGFKNSCHSMLMKMLTGSDKFKILLAQVLFLQPDVLFLDEPTNNLDLKTISYLEEKLKCHEGVLVVISHDRHFLNSVCTHILDLDFKKIREFSGNYDDWYIASKLIVQQKSMERNKKLKEKEELEHFIARFSANASKARQATSRAKQLEKLNIQELETSSRRDPNIIFKPKKSIGNEVLNIENLYFSYDDSNIIKNLNLNILPNDKIALIGRNGIGKSTFCKLIFEELKAEQGSIKWGTTIQYSYFPQNATELIFGEESLYEWLRNFDKKKESAEIRNALGRMLFSGQEQEKNVQSLSGGEKHRLMLSKIMLEGGNFLVLDEPTNHLDLESIISLGEALYKYQGNIICISHDRELIDAYANRIIEFKENNIVIDFKGTYEQYLQVYESSSPF